MLMVVVNIRCGGCDDSHCKTLALGETVIASEITLVSRMIICEQFLDLSFWNRFAWGDL